MSHAFMWIAKVSNRTSSAQLTILVIIIMLSLLTGIFSSPSQAEKSKIYPHQINLSGNIFRFAMLEDFSKDMPAADMVEVLDISDPGKFDNPEYGNLLRRWWDIKKPGWFGKPLGTVMMDVSVQRVVENKQRFIFNSPYNIRNRIDFMLMLDDGFHQRYGEINKNFSSEPGRTSAYHAGLFAVSGSEIHSLYFDKILNGQRWMSYAIAGPQGITLMVYALPISDQLYLEIVFTHSPNHGVSPRELGEVAYRKMEIIESSFKMEYIDGNPFSAIVAEEWIKRTNTEILEEHRDLILLKYGIGKDDAGVESSRIAP